MTEPQRLGTKCQTQAVAIKWAASADGLEANEADGEAFSFTTEKA